MNKNKITIGILVLLLNIPIVSALSGDISLTAMSNQLVPPQSPEKWGILTTIHSTFPEVVTIPLTYTIQGIAADGSSTYIQYTYEIPINANTIKFALYEIDFHTAGDYTVSVTSFPLPEDIDTGNNADTFKTIIPADYSNIYDDLLGTYPHHDIIAGAYTNVERLRLGSVRTPEYLPLNISIINCGTYAEYKFYLKVVQKRTGKVVYEDVLYEMLRGKNTKRFQIQIPTVNLEQTCLDCKSGWNTEQFEISIEQFDVNKDSHPSNNHFDEIFIKVFYPRK